MATREAGGIQSIERAFRVLQALAEQGGTGQLHVVAELADLPQPTAHRILRTMVSLGYVRQEDSRKYALGAGLIALGDVASLPLGAWARPRLAELVEATQETANMAILEASQVTYVAQVPSTQSMRMFTEVGRRAGAHSTAVGKAMLATLPDDAIESIIRRAGMERRTEFTLTSMDDLRAEISRIRIAGHAMDNEEQEIGVRCVAVAVPGAPSPTAISVSGPTQRMTDQAVAEAAATLKSVASKLTEEFAVSA